MTAFGFTEMPAFTKNIEDMTDAEKEVFTVPFMEALPDALKGSLPDDFTKLVEPLYVHPLVARELEAMYHTSTSAGILAQIGDTLSLIYKYQSSQMLASGGWLAYQEIGNSMNLVKRNINPASFFDFQAKRVHAAKLHNKHYASVSLTVTLPSSARLLHVRQCLTTVTQVHGGMLRKKFNAA